VDSRKQVELISSILARARRDATEKAAEEEPEAEEGELHQRWKHVLEGLNILPYRAGYEENDRKFIQEKLGDGSLNGVVSTSALELGLDIPHLDTCVLVGVPASATSLQQRIGRIGRQSAGRVIVVNGGDVTDRTVFADPPSFFTRPLAALYLENHFIQYIHVLCLARHGGENDQILSALHKTSKEFASAVAWPANFIALCREERAGQAPRDLLAMKNEARERPNYVFPLREVESQFRVERVQGPTTSSLGSLSHGQLMREAYPGAIYYYATLPYRVTRVNVKSHQVQVRREKRYTTRPNRLPDRVFPQLTAAGIHQARMHGRLFLGEGNLLVRESINGVIENRGGSEVTYLYPLPRELGFFQDQPFFNRNYFTTGVMLTHPALAVEGTAVQTLAEALYEAFLLRVPFDRGDIGWAADAFRLGRPPVLGENQPFLVIFDQTYGSLRLSSRLLEMDVLAGVLVKAARLAVDAPGGAALMEMAREAWLAGGRRLHLGGGEAPVETGERVILPGSKGLLLRSHEELQVVRVIQTPSGLCYEGVSSSMSGSGATIMPLVQDVVEVPGESQMGTFIAETGEVKPLAVAAEGWSQLDEIPPFGTDEAFANQVKGE
jgi:DEAD/DEAH box helicase domain-containing protein